MSKPEADLGMPLKVPESRGVTPFDSRNSSGIIFLSYEFHRSPEGDLKLMKNRKISRFNVAS